MRNWQEKRGLLTETLSWENNKTQYMQKHIVIVIIIVTIITIYTYVYLTPFLHPSKQRAHAPEKDQELWGIIVIIAGPSAWHPLILACWSCQRASIRRCLFSETTVQCKAWHSEACCAYKILQVDVFFWVRFWNLRVSCIIRYPQKPSHVFLSCTENSRKNHQLPPEKQKHFG